MSNHLPASKPKINKVITHKDLVKEQLAKLMATENIKVRHKKVETAFFDLKNRVLTLPIWENISDDLYSMLIVHEVGHALHSPKEDWEAAIKREPKLGMLMNIVEDARIDRKMKTRFPGCKHSYHAGTKELIEKDYIGINGRQMHEFNIVDRINLHYKGGIYNHLEVPFFTDEEKAFIDEIDNAITFSDVVVIAEKLLKYIKDNNIKANTENPKGKQKKKGKKSKNGKGKKYKTKHGGSSSPNHPSPFDDGDEDLEEYDEDEESSSDDSDSDEDAEGDSEESNASEGTLSDDDMISETMSALNKNILRLSDNTKDVDYCNIPKIDPKNYVIPFRNVHREISNFYRSSKSNDFFMSFKRNSQKIVNYLVKEFEMKKAAAISAKERISNTGTLDTRKLHTYKYNEDIFKRVTDVPKGKNHGLLIFLDCSGSMSSNMPGTLQQLMNLVCFCRKANIIYDVYGFTDHCYVNITDDKGKKTKGEQKFKKDDMVVNNLYLKNYFSSKMSAIEHLDALNNISRLIEGYSGKIGIPSSESLGGTPLDETLIVSNQLAKELKDNYQLDIVHVVFLTDGYGTTPIQIAQDSGYPKHALNDLVVTSSGKDYHLAKEYSGDSTNLLLNVLKRNLNCNIIGFYICDEYQIDSTIKRMYYSDTVQEEKAKEFYKTNGYLSISEAGWDEYYVIPNGETLKIKEDQLKEMGSLEKDQMQNFFIKTLKDQRMNRIILSRFIDKISKKKELTK